MTNDLLKFAKQTNEFSLKTAELFNSRTIARSQQPPSTPYLHCKWTEVNEHNINIYPWSWVWNGSYWIADTYYLPLLIDASKTINGSYSIALPFFETLNIDNYLLDDLTLKTIGEESGGSWDVSINVVLGPRSSLPLISVSNVANNDTVQRHSIPLQSPLLSIDYFSLEMITTRTSGTKTAFIQAVCKLYPIRNADIVE